MIPIALTRIAFAVLLAAGASSISQAKNAGTIPGPVETKVIRVLDGDTFLADAMIWPGQIVRVSVRIRGIDAPEKRSGCAVERQAAAKATATLAALLGHGTVTISNIGGGKYYGRVLADVKAGKVQSVAAVMLHRSLVRPYHGGKRQSLCAK